MSDEMPLDPVTRRALIVWYDDATCEVDVEADEFTWLEVPELLRQAIEWLDMHLPIPALDTEDPDE